MEVPKTVIVKTTSGCNLACSYCYAESSDKPADIISESVLEKTLTELGELNKEEGCTTSLIWHGGEPLLAGLDFFENVAYLQYWLKKEKDLDFDNSIQTNGTLVNSDTIEFCKRHDFGIGFSLDGPRDVHGLTRVDKKGNNSFDRVFRGLNLAREAGLSNGAISILNARSIDRLDEIYDFFKQEDLNLKLNPLINSGDALKHDDLGITPKQYGEALIHLFNKYVKDDDFRTHIDPLDNMMGNVTFEDNSGACTFSENCQRNFISLNPSGDFYPCGRFDGFEDLRFGNIKSQSLAEILNSPVRQGLLERSVERIPGCGKCDYNELCKGGCLSNAYNEDQNILSKDHYCGSYKMIFQHLDKFIEKELEKAEISS